MSAISVILPTYNRPTELRACLQGFAGQTAPKAAFEVIVIDDGSSESQEAVVQEFDGNLNIKFRRIENSGPSVARNTGIDLAGSDLLVLYDDDLAPRPGLIDYSLRFHQSWPGEAHSALLWFRVDPSLGMDAFTRCAFPIFYPFPASSGIYGWGRFWSGSLTCKKSLFRFARFAPKFRALEDAELAIRLGRRIELQVHFERRLMGLHTRLIRSCDLFSRARAFGRHDFLVGATFPGAWGTGVSFEPNAARIPQKDLDATIAAAQAIARSAPPPQTNESRALAAILSKLYWHAFSEGWSEARSEFGSRANASDTKT